MLRLHAPLATPGASSFTGGAPPPPASGACLSSARSPRRLVTDAGRWVVEHEIEVECKPKRILRTIWRCILQPPSSAGPRMLRPPVSKCLERPHRGRPCAPVHTRSSAPVCFGSAWTAEQQQAQHTCRASKQNSCGSKRNTHTLCLYSSELATGAEGGAGSHTCRCSLLTWQQAHSRGAALRLPATAQQCIAQSGSRGAPSVRARIQQVQHAVCALLIYQPPLSVLPA